MSFRLQMLLLLFHALPMLGSFAYGLCTPGCTWMLDWTVYFAGAILQVRHEKLLQYRVKAVRRKQENIC